MLEQLVNRARCLMVAAFVLTCPLLTQNSRAEIQAGAAQRDITPPVGLEIQHYYRISVGVHDPLFARCLYLQDDQGHSLAIICLDLISGGFDACDSLREEIRRETGIENVLINFSHSHSSAALGRRGRTAVSNDRGSTWNDATLDSILAMVQEAQQRAEPVTLRVGRAASQTGFNRRLIDETTGHVFMGVNRQGPRVPWVNVLIADSRKTGKPMSVLFETAAHPVIVPHTTKKTSADYPGAAVQRICEELGDEVIAMFAQGCGGNVNGYPLRSSYENAVSQGRKLGDNVLAAMENSQPIQSDILQVKMVRKLLPSEPLPTEAEWKQMAEEHRDNPDRMRQLRRIRELMDRRAPPPPRRLDVWAVMLGRDWCLMALPHEMFCQYELWIDKNAPFQHTMTLAYTNGYEGYIAVDDAWRMGAKGGYEAASLPNWGGQVHTRHFGPPAVGGEQIIKDAIASLWPKDDENSKPAPIRPADDAPQPMTPRQSATKIRVPDGFSIELVASEPLIQEPSCIAFDHRGRLFVCELHGYNMEGQIDVAELNKTGVLDRTVRRIRWELQGGPIADQAAAHQFGVVKMLTDTNGDGVMDQAEVWAEQLPPCYGLVPARGGIIVVCAPDIIFLADRDGDGSPEIRQTLFTGFRTQVMERGVNNPRWGLDNWIYIGAGGSGGTIRGPRLAKPVELRHSDFRIKPDGSAIEPVTGRVGTFGLTINDIGDRFPSTGGRPAMYALPLPYRYLVRNPHVATPETNHYAATYNRGYRISQPHPWRVKRQQDPDWVKFYGATETNSNFFSGGCSNEFYGDTLFPPSFHGNIFYCEPSLNIVHRCVVSRDGAGYRGQRAASEQQSEFLASTDQWFRPMNLRVGPDGALYIVDMYREIIEDYSAIPRFLQQQYGLDKGRDHGRIWRLVPTNAPKRPIPDLSKLDAVELARLTGDSNAWHRLMAQQLLIQRRAVSAVATLTRQLGSQSSPLANIHALYTLDGLGELRVGHVKRGLDHAHFAVRMHALRLGERWLDADGELLAAILAMTDDSDPRVRLQLAMSLGESHDSRSVAAVLTLARRYGSEQWMDTAILSSAYEHAGALLLDLLGDDAASHQAQTLIRPLAATIAARRDVTAMTQALKTVADLDELVCQRCLAGLVDGVSSGKTPIPQTDDDWAAVVKLLGNDSQPVRDLATKLAASLPLADKEPLQRMFAQAAKVALNNASTIDQRLHAIELLASAPHETFAPTAIELLDARQPLTIQLSAIESLNASSHQHVGRVMLRNWANYTPKVRHAVLTAIMSRGNRVPALLDAIENGAVNRGEIDAIGREQLTANPDQLIALRAEKLFANSTSNAELQKRLVRYRQALSGPRNIEIGKQVFDEHCLACHKLDDRGHDVGPPLATVLNKPNETILLDLLDPSGRIDPEYRSYLVITEDGRMFSGVLISESPTSVTLRQEKGATQSILRQNIDVIKASNVSLMPANFHQQINPHEAADLIAYLRQTLIDSDN